MLIYLNHSCDTVRNEMVNAQGMPGKYIGNFLRLTFWSKMSRQGVDIILKYFKVI